MPPHPSRLAEEVIEPDEGAVTAAFVAFLDQASRRRHPTGPIRRFNQGRASGCVFGEFVVPASLPQAYRVGLFAAPGTYRAAIRFANASSSTDRDKDVRGMAIAVADVPGENLTAGATSQHFVLNSHPVMVTPDAKSFMAFLEASEAGALRRLLYVARHPTVARIGMAARQRPSCHLDISYWSATPYLFGPGRAVKYRVRPTSERRSPMPSVPGDDYLATALTAHLRESEATFDFLVQFQADAATTPIEDATVEWKEDDAPWAPVARLRIPPQAVAAPGGDACEEMAFDPWHALVEHRPLGSMNRARRAIYPALAALRRQRAR
jgi:hypothetical protein